jgi:mono/diheme cytochrome c family protein
MKRRKLRLLATVTAGLLVTGAALGTVAYLKSSDLIGRRYALDPLVPQINSDSEGLARGRHLVQDVMSCTVCHGDDLGGTVIVDARPFMRLAAPNLTRGRGGVAHALDDADWVRAIRHGVRRDGRALAVMPSTAYQHLGDADLGAVIAYLKSVPAVDRTLPPRAFGPIARIQLARGKLPFLRAAEINHAAARAVNTPPASVTVEYGRYLANVAGCTDCHGRTLSGGRVAVAPPGTPPAGNLKALVSAGWTEVEFARALREGTGSGGRQLNEFMPYWSLRLTDAELRAVWTFVRSTPRP